MKAIGLTLLVISLLGADVWPGEKPWVPFETAKLQWEYVLGPPPDDGIPELWLIRCIRVGLDQMITGEAPVTGEAPTFMGEIRLKDFLPGWGDYTCIQVPWNAIVAEGQASPPFTIRCTRQDRCRASIYITE